MKNPLINAQKCFLYDSEKNLLAKARFSKEELGSLTLIFSQKPEFELPEHFDVVPRESDAKFRSYHCKWDGRFSEFSVESTGLTYCICEAKTDDVRDTRQDLRINVSIDVNAIFGTESAATPITIKDMSAGGFMFISSKSFEPGMHLAFPFTQTKTPIVITAEIVASRPAKGTGYVCLWMQVHPPV